MYMGFRRVSCVEANIVKTALVNMLLTDSKYELIANEVPFLNRKRSADMVAIKNGCLIGVEIKSKSDNLRTMQAQLDDYQKVFNKVYLVYSEKFSKELDIVKLPKNVGLIVIDSKGELKVRRVAGHRRNLNKEALISMLWRQDLESLIRCHNKIEYDELKQIAIKQCAIKNIQKQINRSLIGRYGEGYNTLLQEMGSKIILEDLFYITGIKKNRIVF